MSHLAACDAASVHRGPTVRGPTHFCGTAGYKTIDVRDVLTTCRLRKTLSLLAQDDVNACGQRIMVDVTGDVTIR